MKVLKLEMILEVHQLKKQGFKVAAIARKCNLSRTTVYEYLEKDLHEVFDWIEILKTRKRKLDPYREHILSWLKEHPDLSASQIQDWLEERCSFRNVGDNTVRTFVRELFSQFKSFSCLSCLSLRDGSSLMSNSLMFF